MKIRAVAATTAAGRVPVVEGSAVDRAPRRAVEDRVAMIGIRVGRVPRVEAALVLGNRAGRVASAMNATSAHRDRSRSHSSRRLRW